MRALSWKQSTAHSENWKKMQTRGSRLPDPQSSFQNATHQYKPCVNTPEPPAPVSNPLDAPTKANASVIKAAGTKQQPEIYLSKRMAKHCIGKQLNTFAGEPEQLANVSFWLS